MFLNFDQPLIAVVRHVRQWILMLIAVLCTPAFAQEKPFSQIRSGYIGFNGTEYTTPRMACETWSGFQQSRDGAGWYYKFHDTENVKIDNNYVIGCRAMLMPLIEGNAVIGPVNYGSVGVNYRDACDRGMQPTTNGCIEREDKISPTPCTCLPVTLITGEKFHTETNFKGTGPFPMEFVLRYRSKAAPAHMGDDATPTPAPQLPNHSSGVTYRNVRGSRNNNLPLACVPKMPTDAQLADPYFKPACSWEYGDGKDDNATSVAPGAGWRTNLQRSVAAAQDERTAMVARADGRAYLYRVNGGVWSASTDVNGKLTRIESSAGMTRGWKYVDANGVVEMYDVIGRLQSETSRDGHQHVFRYDAAGHLVSMEDAHGRKVTFQYLPDSHMLMSMTDPDLKVTSYTYGAFSNLTKITYPDQYSKTFLYEDARFPNALTGIIDENEKRYITFTYDAEGRVKTEALAGGVSKNTFVYGPDQSYTIVTDAVNSARTTTFAKVQGVGLVTAQTQPAGAGSAAATSRTTYDANGNIATQTDFNGGLTTYVHDLATNLETSRTEASGTPEARTIKTDWDITLRLPRKVAEPKRLTTYTYFPNGALERVTVRATTDANGSAGFTAVQVGLPRTTSYTYNEAGYVKTVTGPRADGAEVVSYEYDSAGNIESITNAAKHKTLLSDYDASGRVGRIVDPNGITTTLTYKPRGWLESRTVTGVAGSSVITKYGYDGVGNMRSAQTGSQTVYYDYDDAHRLEKISDGIGNEIKYTLDDLGKRIAELVTDPSGRLTKQVARVYDGLSRLKQVTGAAQ